MLFFAEMLNEKALCNGTGADETEEIAGLDIVEHGERGYASAMMAGSPIASLENSSEMLANTILSTQKE